MIGRMRHRVSLQARQVVIGEGGSRSASYPEIARVWACIEPAHMPATVVADKIEFPVSHTITTHYSESYEATRRIMLGARMFTVLAMINQDEADKKLLFRCQEAG